MTITTKTSTTTATATTTTGDEATCPISNEPTRSLKETHLPPRLPARQRSQLTPQDTVNKHSLSEGECIKYYQVSTSRSWSHLTSLTLNFKIFDLSDTHPASPGSVIIELPVVILWLVVRSSWHWEKFIDEFLIRWVILVFIFFLRGVNDGRVMRYMQINRL